MRRTMGRGPRKIPTTSMRRRISRLSLSAGLLDQVCRRMSSGNVVNARRSSRASLRWSATAGRRPSVYSSSRSNWALTSSAMIWSYTLVEHRFHSGSDHEVSRVHSPQLLAIAEGEGGPLDRIPATGVDVPTRAPAVVPHGIGEFAVHPLGVPLEGVCTHFAGPPLGRPPPLEQSHDELGL